MAQVSVTINGRQYRMGCDEGQEAHVTKLAQDIDSLIDGLRSAHGEIGDQRQDRMPDDVARPGDERHVARIGRCEPAQREYLKLHREDVHQHRAEGKIPTRRGLDTGCHEIARDAAQGTADRHQQDGIHLRVRIRAKASPIFNSNPRGTGR